ncbi:MAG TPA: conjugal transfer protein TraN [Rhodanobacteraceae bacterium]|nr:conjugal transfer protein TraN [Rhodanobacteraceae bacterium]
MMRSLSPRWRTAFALLLTCLATSAGAQNDPRTSAQDGQAFGRQLQQQQAGRLPTFQEGGDKGAGTVTISGQEIPVNQLTPGADAAEVEKLKALKDAPPDALRAATDAKQKALDADPRAAAGAYRTIVNQQRADQDAMGRDSTLWDTTRQTLSDSNMGLLSKQYADCKATTTYFKSGAQSAAMTHESSCEILNGRDGATRSREVDLTTSTETPYADTLVLTQDQDLSFPVSTSTQGITSAEVTLDWSGPVKDVVFTDYPSAFNSWMVGLHVTYDGTLSQMCTLPSGQACSPGALDCTCKPGPASVTVTVNATITRLKETLTSTPDNPLMESDGFCTATWKCEDSAPRTVGGVTIDGSFADVLTPLYPTRPGNQPPSSMSPICWKASATYDCPYNIGEFGCWTTPSGERKCHTNTQQNTTADTCGALVARGCRLLRRACAQGATGWGGTCYVENQVYDCPQMVDVDSIGSRTTYDCAGSVRCMGNDCLNDPQTETAQGFATTQAKLTLLQHVLSDSSTDIQPTPVQHPDGTTSSSGAAAPGAAQDVTLFRGAAYECRKALGSTVDCCTEADSGGETLWMDLYAKHTRQGNAEVADARLRAQGDPERGSWAKLADPSNRNMATMNSGFTSRRESFQGGGTQTGTATGTTTIGHGTKLKPVMDEYRQEKTTDEGLRNSWACTAAEMDLAVQREAGACVNLGGYCSSTVLGACIEKRDVYCCFNSPLTRSIRVQMAGGEAAVANGAFGTPKAPRCEGVAVSAVDGSVIDKTPLSDFIARMKQGNALPTLETLQAKTSEDRLTGQGSRLVRPGQTRPTVSTRTQARVAAIDPDATTAAIHAEAQGAIPAPKGEPNVTGVVGLTPAYIHAVLGESAAIRVGRWGSAGAASVRVTLEPDTARPGQHYQPVDAVVHWADGESGSKEVPITTIRNTDAVTTPLRAKIRLSEPSPGLRIDPSDSGDLVFEPAAVVGSPGMAPPSLRLSKTLEKGEYSATQHAWTLTYRIVAVNDGPSPVSVYTINDELPAGAILREWGNAADPGWNEYCASPPLSNHGTFAGGNGLVAWCAGGNPINAGTRIEMRAVLTVNDPVSSVTNVCLATYRDTQGREFATNRSDCTVTSPLVPPPTPATGCEARGGMHSGYTVFTGAWNDYLPAFPGDGSKAPLALARDAVSAYRFVTTSTTGALTVSVTADYVPGAGFPSYMKPASVVYARISPCAGDLSLPTNTPADPFSMQSCTTVAVGGTGGFTTASAMHLEVSDAFPSDEGTCRLLPDQPYYLNVVTNDATDGTVVAGDNRCDAQMACIVNVQAGAN